MTKTTFGYNIDGEVIAHPIKQGEPIAYEHFTVGDDGRLTIILEDVRDARGEGKKYNITSNPTALRIRFLQKARADAGLEPIKDQRR